MQTILAVLTAKSARRCCVDANRPGAARRRSGHGGQHESCWGRAREGDDGGQLMSLTGQLATLPLQEHTVYVDDVTELKAGLRASLASGGWRLVLG